MKEIRLKSIVKRKITDGPHVSPEYSDTGVPFISGSEISNGKIFIRDNTKKIATNLHNEFYKRTPTKFGDILLVKNGSIGNCAFVDTAEIFSIWVPLALIKIKKHFNSKFIFYNIVSEHTQKYLKQNASDAAQPNISINTINNIVTLNISLFQQTAIANYLDQHTTKIDKEISLLEQKVEKLDEYKQALIYETVTKGLYKNVPMKDSGIEWIGLIPEHWEVKRVSNFFKSPKVITNPGRKDVLSLTLNGVVEKDIESNKGLSPESYDTYQIFKSNDLVFKLIDLANYNTSRVGRVWKDGIMSSAYVRLSKNTNTNVDYFYYQFFDLYKRAIFNMLGGNGVRSAINRGDLLNLSIVNPTKKEQQEIANFLDNLCSKIDQKKELINKKIELLKEYKQSLIYETVTGKNNVGELNETI